jgi:threonine dehydratase
MIGLADVRAAAERIRTHVHRTPLLRSRSLDAAAGCRLLLKAENLQKGGAFKLRGALNTMLQLSAQERGRGVVTHSSGNHAQGLAIAAGILHTRAVAVMPQSTNPLKVAAVLGYGAQVVQEGVTGENREQVVERLIAEHGYTLVHPFDDDRIIAGQGTVGLELAEDCPDPECVVVPIGGGGLVSGIATAIKALRPQARVVGVETEGADDAARSLRSGTRQRLPAAPSTIADGIRTLSVGERNWEIIRRLVDDIVVVTDAEVMDALRFLLTRVKTVVEPTGAVSVAALLSGRIRATGTVAAVLSGGNLDLRLLAE